MYIKSIELQNFQKHSHFKAEFADTVNVLYGESDIGKSCIIRALRWVLVGDIHGDVIRKEGTKKTSVTVVLDNGIKVTRIKSDSVNRYEVNNGKEVIKYDSVGRKLPEPIANLFNIPILEIDKEKVVLNIHSQLDAPFLLSQSGGFRVKVLNKLTGNHILDKVSQSLNKDILSLNKQNKLLKEELKEKYVQVECLKKEKKEKDGLYLELSKRQKDLETLQRRLDKGREILEKIKNNQKEQEIFNGKLKDYSSVDLVKLEGLQLKINKLEKISEMNKQINLLESELDTLEIESTDIEAPEIDIKTLLKRAERLEIVARLAQELQSIEKRAKTLGSQKESNIALINEKIQAYKVILQKYGKCPTCHTKIDENVLKGIDL